MPVTRAMVTGCSVSASLVAIPRSASASRFRSRHALTGLCAVSVQYSGGRPGPDAGSGALSQPGTLQVTAVVCSVIIGPPGLVATFNASLYHFISFHNLER